ncbi:hypothetical protein [Burkholderia multivorans]|uniref:hypothetical protein n=1 Tax=Burkholderia multivorans TaxID=87883 RepID=UPI00057FCE3B|nr:hypothetical protein [Burkholderia multivorans]MDR9230293.1 hypothetical protein [Burkholderia multivorans]HDR9474356.1 hypothetical protein [Burkholderia multivorans]HDR9480198.1 hypothetical protein [Burkholderia multivorans]
MILAQRDLIRYIEGHHARAVPLGTDKVLCEENFASYEGGFPDESRELYGPYWTPVVATVSDVRNWLGY